MLCLRRHLSLGTLISLVTLLGCANSPSTTATSGDAGSAAVYDRSAAFAYAASLGRGINLGNALEAPKEGDWGVILTDADFDLVQSAGFNHVRIPVRFSGHADVIPPYTLDPAFLARADWAIQSALDRGLKVILDFHNKDDELFTDPDGQTPRFLAIWKQLAEHYAAFPQALVFEPLNEPHGAVDLRTSNDLLAAALTVIRASNPNRMVVVGPAGWSHIEGLSTLVLPDSDPYLMATFHYYDPMAFTHQAASESIAWPGPAGDKKSMVAQFQAAAEWSQKQNRPVYVGEFGANHFADMEARGDWTQAVVAQCDAHHFPYAYWELRSEFGAWDSTVKAWHKEIVDVLLPGNTIPASAEITGNCVPKVIPDSPHLRIESLAMSDEDYVQSSPAVPVPDQARDLKVEVTVSVGVKAFLVMSVDNLGKAAPVKGYVAEWDTIMDDASPLSVLCTPYTGLQTWAIAVVEKGTVLNTATGALPPLTVEGERRLALHLGYTKSLEGSGAVLRVFALTTEGDLIASAPWPTNF